MMIEMRTPEQFAIEHAEYMAKAAERLMDAIDGFHVATEAGTEEQIDDASECVSEARRNLRMTIYEFRKRAKNGA